MEKTVHEAAHEGVAGAGGIHRRHALHGGNELGPGAVSQQAAVLVQFDDGLGEVGGQLFGRRLHRIRSGDLQGLFLVGQVVIRQTQVVLVLFDGEVVLPAGIEDEDRALLLQPLVNVQKAHVHADQLCSGQVAVNVLRRAAGCRGLLPVGGEAPVLVAHHDGGEDHRHAAALIEVDDLRAVLRVGLFGKFGKKVVSHKGQDLGGNTQSGCVDQCGGDAAAKMHLKTLGKNLFACVRQPVHAGVDQIDIGVAHTAHKLHISASPPCSPCWTPDTPGPAGRPGSRSSPEGAPSGSPRPWRCSWSAGPRRPGARTSSPGG